MTFIPMMYNRLVYGFILPDLLLTRTFEIPLITCFGSDIHIRGSYFSVVFEIKDISMEHFHRSYTSEYYFLTEFLQKDPADHASILISYFNYFFIPFSVQFCTQDLFNVGQYTCLLPVAKCILQTSI